MKLLLLSALLCTAAALTADEILSGASDDEAFLHSGSSPGKRCANLMDESCANGGIADSVSDEDWLNTGSPGKRNVGAYETARRFCAGSLNVERCLRGYLLRSALRKRMFQGSKRCANVFEEGCINGGLTDSVNDELYLNDGLNPGR